jgi:parvulin-like peptidyl-prolyl isomerase
MVVGLSTGRVLLTALALVAAVRPLAAADREAVVATVGDDAIRAGEVERLVALAMRGKKIDAESLRFLQAQSLEEIIARRLVMAYARHRAEVPTKAELAAEWGVLKSQLAARRLTIEEILKTESISEADLKRRLAWNVVWRKLTTQYVTEERLAAYFAAHRRDYDGTQLAVSHILLWPSGDKGIVSTDELRAPDRTSDGPHPLPLSQRERGVAAGILMKQAEKIRQEVVAGKLSFAEAARKYSAGPSGKDGGRLGLIGRHGPMDETFSRAAFALIAGEVSRPVRTAFGVHLIRCDEVKPGDRQMADVRKELDDALSHELLDKLAASERQHTSVSYTGVLPHFKPGTHELEPGAK